MFKTLIFKGKILKVSGINYSYYTHYYYYYYNFIKKNVHI